MPVLQVFEHQRLLVGHQQNDMVFGEQHLQALTGFSNRHGQKYFTLVHRGVQFKHYVGVLMVGDLTIEILPKADRHKTADPNLWQGVLLDMLKYCRLIPVHTHGIGPLSLRRASILELFYEVFLELVEELIRRGLPRKYHPVKQVSPVLRGRLDLSKQIQQHYLSKSHFHIIHHQYDQDQLLNQIVLAGLQLIKQITSDINLRNRIKIVEKHFSGVGRIWPTERHFQLAFRDRAATPHREILEMTRLLLLNFHPDLRAGKHHLLALLFDMNLLFEEYVFRQLRNLPARVDRQQRRSFWKRRTIRPDIVLEIEGSRFVLDTKWQILHHSKPSMEALKQLYIYLQYFDARHGILLYPRVNELDNSGPAPFHPVEAGRERYFCQIYFLNILQAGKLNRNLGAEILQQIRKAL